MNFEVLKKSHLKRNIIIGVIVVTIISTIILNFTRAKYRVTQSIPLVNGTINYSLADFNAVAIYVNGDSGYTKADTIPDGYVLNESESYCTVNGEEDTSISLSYDTATKSLSVTPMTTKGTKCYLYFDEKGITNIQELIASKNLATRTDFSTTLTTNTTGTIYQAQDDDGTTYYFAGNTNDNWVSWAGFYWRIIRINGDGTLRLIYNGTSKNQTGSGTQIGTSAFNSSYNNNMYVGFKYTSNNVHGTGTGTSAFNSSYNNNMYVGFKYTSNNVHGTGTNSTILGELNEWYTTSGIDDYADDIDMNAGFCNDRQPSTSNSTSNGSGGIGTTTTYYGAYIRLYSGGSSSNASPSFKCSNSSDLFTVSSSNKGNKALQYPIGLITADEVAFAGGVYGKTNESYYLYTGQAYWTMSPYWYSSGHANVFLVWSAGNLNNAIVNSVRSVRPVINLRSDVTISGGDGTSSNPYTIS